MLNQKNSKEISKLKQVRSNTLSKVLRVAAALALGLSLTSVYACSGKSDSPVIGATPAPHAEILNLVLDDLKADGYQFEIVEYTDYTRINADTATGDLKVNFFQHKPFLDEYNAKNGTNLVSVAAIHFEPLAIYPGKTSALSELESGAVVAIPNDVTNEARALHLLAAAGLIELSTENYLSSTPTDIVSNPLDLEFRELEAAAIPRAVEDVDIAVINGNYAIGAGLNLSNILVSEESDPQAVETYANIVVVEAGHENDADVQALVKALTSNKVREFIEQEYQGSVVAAF